MPDSPLSNDSTNEVLSQIANEEIDRMLAEAQDQIPSDDAPMAAASAPEPEPATAPVAPVSSSRVSSNVVAEEANHELNHQLDDLFNALNEAAADVPPPPR